MDSPLTLLLTIKKATIPTLVLTNRFKGSEHHMFTLSQMAPPVGFYIHFFCHSHYT